MKGERPVRLLLPPVSTGRAAPRSGASRRGTSPVSEKPGAQDTSSGIVRVPDQGAAAARRQDLADAGDPVTAALFEALRRHRLAVARAEGIAPFIVASDRTLRDIAALRPRDLDELQQAYGIGPGKAERYGAGLLEVVASLASEGAPR
jgi:ATP-dependent DNA helicase RecQ